MDRSKRAPEVRSEAKETHIPLAEDDGLRIPEVGSWVEDKYRLVSLYDKLFSTGMKKQWDVRVYIDLYAGPGYARIRGTNRILWGSPLLALQVPDQFDKYIFCETDQVLMKALKQRVARLFPHADVEFILGDCNECVDDICACIPSQKRHRVLSVCFVDPYDIGIKFSTIRKLSSRRMDFLFLLALYMDANRNVVYYTGLTNPKIDEFLGTDEWRAKWEHERCSGVNFPQFLGQEYAKQMETLGYLPTPLHSMKQVRSDDRNLPLYYLALFSKHERACKFWDEVLKYGTNQISFDFAT